MEVEYRAIDIENYREWLTEIGEDERDYTDAQIINMLAQEV